MKKWALLSMTIAAGLALLWCFEPVDDSGVRETPPEARRGYALQSTPPPKVPRALAPEANAEPSLKAPERSSRQPFVKVACESEIFEAFTEAGACERDVAALRGVMESRIERLQASGMRLDRERCVAMDSEGGSTDLDSISESLLDMANAMVLGGSDFSLETHYEKSTFGRLNLVAICSLMKTMDYWSAHPEELPSPESVQNYLFFDIHKGKPVESFFTGAFLRALATWQRFRKQSE